MYIDFLQNMAQNPQTFTLAVGENGNYQPPKNITMAFGEDGNYQKPETIPLLLQLARGMKNG